MKAFSAPTLAWAIRQTLSLSFYSDVSEAEVDDNHRQNASCYPVYAISLVDVIKGLSATNTH